MRRWCKEGKLQVFSEVKLRKDFLTNQLWDDELFCKVTSLV